MLTASNNGLSGNKIAFGQISPKLSVDVDTREAIRADMENTLDSTFEYLNELGNLSRAELEYKMKIKERQMTKFASEKANPEIENIETEVDSKLLEEQKIKSYRERQKNHIYTGQKLSMKPESIAALKKAGIKSVVLLTTCDTYKEKANMNGLNYVELSEIGNKSLHVFNFDAVERITKNPESYATNNDSGVEDLKDFVNIVNGKNPKYPHPLYMGCEWGSERTWEWYTISQILKDQPQDEPLTADRAEKLSELVTDIREAHRW